jgi:lipopolysaccharide transport system permease protein
MITVGFRAVWSYRGFIFGSVLRDFQSKYQNSLLGALWNVINPLAMITVYTVIFSQVMRARLPGVDSTFAYSIYLCAGIISWSYFAEITSRAQNIFIEQANLLKKVNFPRICLPIVVVLTASLNFGILLGLFLLFLLLTGNFPGVVIFALIPLLIVQIVFSIGLGITLGVLNVFFRDIGQLFGVVLQFWFWLTPIVYSVDILPRSVQPLMDLNPMAGLMASYQGIFVKGLWPEWQNVWLIAVLGVLLCGVGLSLFRERSNEIVDEL